MLLEKKLENVYKLENAVEHSVCKKSEAKCEGVSFPGGVTDFVVCCAAVGCFFQATEELKNFRQGLDRLLGGLDGSTDCPPGSSGAGQKARVRNWGSGGGWGP